MDFSTLRFLKNKENHRVFWETGVGKPHMRREPGIEAAKKGTGTYFIKCHDLIQQTEKANDRKSAGKPFEELQPVTSC